MKVTTILAVILPLLGEGFALAIAKPNELLVARARDVESAILTSGVNNNALRERAESGLDKAILPQKRDGTVEPDDDFANLKRDGSIEPDDDFSNLKRDGSVQPDDDFTNLKRDGSTEPDGDFSNLKRHGAVEPDDDFSNLKA
ncbi:MAG: hypothetical protein Q9162_003045 [Coniocarpon cinnabarinum]